MAGREGLGIRSGVFWWGGGRVSPVANGSSWTTGGFGAAAADLHQSHGNVGFEPHLRITPQLWATILNPLKKGGQGLNPCPHVY